MATLTTTAGKLRVENGPMGHRFYHLSATTGLFWLGTGSGRLSLVLTNAEGQQSMVTVEPARFWHDGTRKGADEAVRRFVAESETDQED